MKVCTVTVELRGVFAESANNMLLLKKLCQSTVESLKYRSLQSYFHQFSPQGITLIILLSESHLAIHTWPERGYVQLTLVSCKSFGEPEKQQMQQIFSELSTDQQWNIVESKF